MVECLEQMEEMGDKGVLPGSTLSVFPFLDALPDNGMVPAAPIMISEIHVDSYLFVHFSKKERRKCTLV